MQFPVSKHAGPGMNHIPTLFVFYINLDRKEAVTLHLIPLTSTHTHINASDRNLKLMLKSSSMVNSDLSVHIT